MSTKAFYAGGIASLGANLNFADFDAGSPGNGSSLWQSCPLLAINQDPMLGYEMFDDFVGIVKAADAWIATPATSGTATAGTLAGGTANLNAGASTAHQGIQIQRAGGAFSPAAGKHLWFEARFKVNVLTAELLWGLFDIDTTLIATGALHATDGIGIKSVTGDGVCLPVVGSSSTYTTGSSIKTLSTATYTRLGFTVNGTSSIQFYVDGAAVGSAVTTNIPSVVLAPSFVCQANGTGTPQMDLDYAWIVQLR
jgi:hypothetical protein